MSIQEANQNLYSNRASKMILDIDTLSDIAKKDVANDNISVYEHEQLNTNENPIKKMKS